MPFFFGGQFFDEKWEQLTIGIVLTLRQLFEKKIVVKIKKYLIEKERRTPKTSTRKTHPTKL